MTTKEMDAAYIAHTYGRNDIVADHGKGAILTDEEGREYVDFTSGIGVNCLGYCDDGWVQAVCRQAATLSHVSNLYYSRPMAELAKLLCEKTGCQKVFFGNSGAEANEGAIKAARKYSFDHYGKGRSTIVSLKNSFHGRTTTTLSATGQEVFHQFFDPFTEGFVFVEAGDLAAASAAMDETVCGVMVEFIQGEGGVVPLEKEYVQALAGLCRERDILLIADEVQTGVGRTGTFLAQEQFGVRADLTTLAKGLGGGLPIGAVLFGEKTAETLGLSQHGSTFGGNPIACAGGIEVMHRLDEAFLAEVREKGEYLKEKLAALPHVEGVTGLGLMLGVTLGDGLTAREVVAACHKRGAMFLTAKEKIRLLPPLVITREEIDRGAAVLEQVLKEA